MRKRRETRRKLLIIMFGAIMVVGLCGCGILKLSISDSKNQTSLPASQPVEEPSYSMDDLIEVLRAQDILDADDTLVKEVRIVGTFGFTGEINYVYKKSDGCFYFLSAGMVNRTEEGVKSIYNVIYQECYFIVDEEFPDGKIEIDDNVHAKRICYVMREKEDSWDVTIAE